MQTALFGLRLFKAWKPGKQAGARGKGRAGPRHRVSYGL